MKLDLKERMRGALVVLAEMSRAGEIDGGEFQGVMLDHGLMLEVPASYEFQAEHGGDTMIVLDLSE